MKKSLAVILMICLTVCALTPAAGAAAEPKVTAYAASVYDYDNDELIYSYHGDYPVVPASTTKLMTAYIVFQCIEEGSMTMQTRIPISRHVQSVSYDRGLSNVPLSSGSTYTVAELMDAFIVYSACAVGIAFAEYISGSEEAFVERMNITAKDLKMNAVFYDSYGLSDKNRVTANDMVRFSAHFIRLYPEILDISSKKIISFRGSDYYNSNRMVRSGAYYYEGADGLKTGTTDAAGNCLISTAVRNGRRIVAASYKSADTAGRYTNCKALLDYGFEYAAVRDTAVKLNKAGLLKGKSIKADGTPDYALSSKMTRAEAVTMLVRLMGLEKEALETRWTTPFEDIGGYWYEAYVGCAYHYGLTNGVSETKFNPDAPATVNMYTTFVLRALGYSVDYQSGMTEAVNRKLFTPGNKGSDDISRLSAVDCTVKAMSARCNGSGRTLAGRLADLGVLTEAKAKSLGFTV